MYQYIWTQSQWRDFVRLVDVYEMASCAAIRYGKNAFDETSNLIFE